LEETLTYERALFAYFNFSRWGNESHKIDDGFNNSLRFSVYKWLFWLFFDLYFCFHVSESESLVVSFYRLFGSIFLF